MATDPENPPRDQAPDDEISDEVLNWISGGKDAHGCPACPHNALGPSYQDGAHILVDGSIFQDGAFKRKL